MDSLSQPITVFNSLGLGDVDVVVSGVLKLASNTALVLGSNSNISITGNR